MHKARSLANVYYWNKYYKKNNIDKHFKMHLPKNEALKFISEDEYNIYRKLRKRKNFFLNIYMQGSHSGDCSGLQNRR